MAKIRIMKSLPQETLRKLQRQVRAVEESLTEVEREVLEYRLGLVDGFSRTAKETGIWFGMTSDQVSQIEQKVFAKSSTPPAPAKRTPRLTKARLQAIVRKEIQEPRWMKKVFADAEQGVDANKHKPDMRLCILTSGSGGNCLCVASGATCVLVDAGITLPRLKTGLKQFGMNINKINAILFTHEHADHWGKAALDLHRLHGVPLYANKLTGEAMDQILGRRKLQWQVFETGTPFSIGDLLVEPFAVPHGAAEPVGFVIDDGHTRLGIATDLGMGTEIVRRSLSDCDALVLEANRDVGILGRPGIPGSIARRVKGCRGHFSNDQTAALLAKVISPRLKTVVLAHLSSECNTPELAAAAVRQVLVRAARTDVQVEVAAAEPPGVIIKLQKIA
jgi:phosphoribosyl 1,2-cyclic phosphodiesterase